MEEGSVRSVSASQKIKQMEAGGDKKSLESSSIWGDPSSLTPTNPTPSCLPDPCRQSRDTVGTCLIVFALPLLIPGVTLTAVAFHDETGFTKYSALHVLGMVMLVGAGLFILVGVALIARIGYKVVPDYNDSSPSVSTKGSNERPSTTVLGSETSILDKSSKELKTSSSIVTIPLVIPPLSPTKGDPQIPPGAINTSAPSSEGIPPSRIPLNFMIEAGQGHNPDLPSTPPKSSTVGSLPLITTMQAADLSHRLSNYSVQSNSREGLDEYMSSSYDEYSDDLDSDENSSGSYVITGENGAFQYSDEEELQGQNSTPLKHENFNQDSVRTSVTPRSGLTLNIPPSRNFFFDENFTNSQSFPECTKVKRMNRVSPLGQRFDLPSTGQNVEATSQLRIDPHHMGPQTESDVFLEASRRSPMKHSHSTTRCVPSPMGSPRQRLEAISNVSALASSMQLKANDDLRLENIIGEMSESNGSVFTSGEETEPVLEEDTKDTKRLSADDVICRQMFTPSPKRTFSFDVTTEDECCVAQNSRITDASGSLTRSGSQIDKNISSSSSPKLVGILRSTSAYDTFTQDRPRLCGDDNNENNPSSLPSSSSTSGGQHSGGSGSDFISSAMVSPSTAIFNVVNMNFKDGDRSKSVGPRFDFDLVTPQCISQERHLQDPVTLKAKKHAKFKSEGDADSLNVTYYD